MSLTTTIPAGRRGHCLLLLRNFPAPPLQGLFEEGFYAELLSPPVVDILIRAVGSSTVSQYKPIWESFNTFVSRQDFPSISDSESFVLYGPSFLIRR